MRAGSCSRSLLRHCCSASMVRSIAASLSRPVIDSPSPSRTMRVKPSSTRKPLLVRAGDQQAAIVGAKVERRINGAARPARGGFGAAGVRLSAALPGRTAPPLAAPSGTAAPSRHCPRLARCGRLRRRTDRNRSLCSLRPARSPNWPSRWRPGAGLFSVADEVDARPRQAQRAARAHEPHASCNRRAAAMQCRAGRRTGRRATDLRRPCWGIVQR